VAVGPARERGRLSYQGSRRVEADYKASNTPETLVGNSVC